MAKCTSHPLDVPIVEVPIAGSLKAHDILLMISIVCTIIACNLSFYLIWRHLTNYTHPKTQKLIIRILFMVPVYTICCVFSIEYYKEHVYIAAIYEFYESIVIASFFLLLCRYLHIEMHSLRRAFALIKPKPWLHPVRFFRMRVWRKKTNYTEDGLKWFGIIWAAVFQFCVVKFLGALAKCITEAANVYCKESGSFRHARIWIQIIEIVSLFTAMLCLLQFYSQTSVVLANRHPLLKFVAIKLIVFLFYAQSFIFSRLTTEDGKMQPTDKLSYPSLSVGIPNALLCVEMAGVAVLHLWAYPWKEYSVNIAQIWETSGPDTENMLHASSQQNSLATGKRQPWWQALIHVLNFGDVIKGIAEGFHGLRNSRRKAMMAHFGNARTEDNTRPYHTENLFEALELVYRGPG